MENTKNGPYQTLLGPSNGKYQTLLGPRMATIKLQMA